MNHNIISDNISRLRKRKGLPQSEVAERIFISQNAISKWEQGKSVPQELLQRLKKKYVM